MNESAWLPSCLECIEKQSYKNISVVICVNQPENYREQTEKKHICDDNAFTLEYLRACKNLPLHIIDKSSAGHGWRGKKHGVGWARKVIMDYIAGVAEADDIILSMDADTVFNSELCRSVAHSFYRHQKATALALPYYHRLTGDTTLDRAMLRYEIYMRYYAINLWRIKNPYCFTAIGSSMAVPVHAYRAIGGITPKLSGEDFYFLQKLRKYGDIIVWNEEKTFPATRYSDRVFFGTGPALIKGVRKDWDSYPMYSYQLFDEVKQTYHLFEELFHADVPTPIDGFLEKAFLSKNIWAPLRENFKDKKKFVRACAEKVDGLRILQFLKSSQQASDNEMRYLVEYLKLFHQAEAKQLLHAADDLHFDTSALELLDQLRDLLTDIESTYRKKYEVIHWF